MASRKKRTTEEEGGDVPALFEKNGAGGGQEEEVQKIMQALGIKARPSVEIVYLPVASLIIPRAQLATITESARLIARSIPIAGIQDPIKAVMVAGAARTEPDARFLVLDGRRRSVAARMRELEVIPCCLYDASATTAQLQALIIAIGNMQRRDEWRREVEALNQLVRGEKEIFKGDQVRLSRAGLDAYGKDLRDAVFVVEDDPLLHGGYDHQQLGDRYRLDGLDELVLPHQIVKVGRGLTEDQLLMLGFAPETLKTRLSMAFLPDPLVELIVGGRMNETVARWMVSFLPSTQAHFAELARTGQPITPEAVKKARAKQITPQALPGTEWVTEQTAPTQSDSSRVSVPETTHGDKPPALAGSLAERLTLIQSLIRGVTSHLDPSTTPETEQVLFLFTTLSPLLEIVARQCGSALAANGTEPGHKEVQHD